MTQKPHSSSAFSSQLKKSHQAVILATLLLIITAIHYSISFQNELLHIILGHLYILPILMAAFWFDLRGGLIVGAASSLLFAPHIFIHWGHMPTVELSNFIEIVLYLLIGFVTGILSRGEKRQRLQYQEALARLDESHSRLKEQADMLAEADEQLRRADRLSALGQLSAGMAHEIRNPLGSIKGTAEILQEDFTPQDKKYEFLQIMLKEINRLDRILAEFLMFAKPASPERGIVKVNELLASVLSLVGQQASKNNVRIAAELNNDVTVRADEGLLRQAFLNLVLNAIQAMPEGGILRADAAMTDGKAGKRECSITIADSGPGISEENLKRLFNPFFTTKKEGTGLGLVITHRIVEAHGGAISVQSRANEGTIFTIKLPVERG